MAEGTEETAAGRGQEGDGWCGKAGMAREYGEREDVPPRDGGPSGPRGEPLGSTASGPWGSVVQGRCEVSIPGAMPGALEATRRALGHLWT